MGIKTLLGANIKLYRRAKHLSQDQLSNRVGLSVKHLSKIERGIAFISSELLEKISASLEVSPAHFFCKANEKIYDDAILYVFDRITETHIIRAMDGIKMDIRRSSFDNSDAAPQETIQYEIPREMDQQVMAAEAPDA